MDFVTLPPARKIAWVNVFYLSITPIGTAILAPIYFAQQGWQWSIILFTLVSCVITNLAITGGYHRLFAHRSYEARGWVRLLYLFVGAGAFQGSALKWASDHRRHHREVDTPDDPYNINQGFFWAHMGWLMVEDNPKYANQFAADLKADKWIWWQHKYYLPIALFAAFAVPTLIGWALGSWLGGLVLGGGLRLVITNHCTFFINSLCHMVGKQPYTDENTARDSFIMAILATGEGYHNFHHLFQADYRNGVKWYHFDPTKWLVGGMALLGWTYKLKRTPPTAILAARLRMEEKRLVAQGFAAEKLASFRSKIEETQLKVRWLKQEYRKKKASVQSQGRERLAMMREEIKIAKIEFRLAWAQYVAYKRARLVPATA